MSQPKRFRIRTVRGEPYHVAGRTLIPVARVVAYSRAGGTIAAEGVGGAGGGFVEITPLAVVEETADGERSLPIGDATARALWGLLGLAVAWTLFLAFVRLWSLSRRIGGRHPRA